MSSKSYLFQIRLSNCLYVHLGIEMPLYAHDDFVTNMYLCLILCVFAVSHMYVYVVAILIMLNKVELYTYIHIPASYIIRATDSLV
jgi:hypothetical protein